MGSRNVEIVAVLLLVFLSLVTSEKVIGQTNAHVRASEIFPLHSGQLTSYKVFTTDTAGSPISTSESYASTRVAAANVVFEGASNVTLVFDTTGGQSAESVSDIHYTTDGAGDIRAFADANFLSLFAPPSVSKSLTPPDSFVNYFVLSQGDRSYHMFSLNQDVLYQSMTVTIAVELNGRFRGLEKIEVPSGRFDSAYHFTITANVKASLHGAELMNEKNSEEIWLVRGVGIIKTTMPSINKGLVQVSGKERQMTGHWDAPAVAAVSEAASSLAARLYPNPAAAGTTLVLDAASSSNQVALFNAAGQQVESFSIAGHTKEFHLDTRSLPSGDYFVAVHSSNTSTNLSTSLLRLTVSR